MALERQDNTERSMTAQVCGTATMLRPSIQEMQQYFQTSFANAVPSLLDFGSAMDLYGTDDLLAQNYKYDASMYDRATTSKKYVPDALKDQTVSELTYTKKSKEFLEEARKEITEFGEDPKKAVAKLMENNRVLIIGEVHLSPNPARVFGTGIMDDLRAKGATHLALEIDERAQPKLDQFIMTGKISEDLKQTFQEYAPLLNSDDYFALLKSARDAGLKLVAVDKQRGPSADATAGQPIPPAVNESAGRDQFMTDKLEHILKSPDSKVVLWVGLMHAADPAGFAGTVDELLKTRYKTASITTEIPGDDTTLLKLSAGATEAIAVPTHKTKKIAELPSDGSFLPNHYRDWDCAIVFPKSTR
jgi:hypothetical protein